MQPMATSTTTISAPPVAPKKPHSFTHHGVTVTDDYAWLRDSGYPEVTDPAVLAHLEAENAWFETRMMPHQPLIDTLFKEMRGRIKEADKSVPQKDGDWLYWIEFEDGAEYKKWWRKPVAGGADELILDEVALARCRSAATASCSPSRSTTTVRSGLPRGSR
jgi:oligopeptidase B